MESPYFENRGALHRLGACPGRPVPRSFWRKAAFWLRHRLNVRIRDAFREIRFGEEGPDPSPISEEGGVAIEDFDREASVQ